MNTKIPNIECLYYFESSYINVLSRRENCAYVPVSYIKLGQSQGGLPNFRVLLDFYVTISKKFPISVGLREDQTQTQVPREICPPPPNLTYDLYGDWRHFQTIISSIVKDLVHRGAARAKIDRFLKNKLRLEIFFYNCCCILFQLFYSNCIE